MMRYPLMALAFPLALAACGAAEPVWAPDDEVARKVYFHDGPPTLTLYTVVNKGSGNGAHTGLMVNGSQRVIFDPAGTFGHPSIPERNDVIIGATPEVEGYYTEYHARETYDVIKQTIEVSPDVAERALQQVLSYGAVPKANCARAVTDILEDLPGFENIDRTWFPNNVRDDFAAFPTVKTEIIADNSPAHVRRVAVNR